MGMPKQTFNVSERAMLTEGIDPVNTKENRDFTSVTLIIFHKLCLRFFLFI